MSNDPPTRPPSGEGSAVQLRCSVALIRRGTILLLYRTDDPGSLVSGDWVLPGGNPRQGESMHACAMRETQEETGVLVDLGRCLFVYEISTPLGGRVVELVFAAKARSGGEPQLRKAGRHASFVSLERIGELNLGPPIAGHLSALSGQAVAGGHYLGNLWRPADRSGANCTRGSTP